MVTKRINELRGTPSNPIWQRNYYDPTRKKRSGAHKPRHIIQTDAEYLTIAAYIESNPANWATDKENVASI